MTATEQLAEMAVLAVKGAAFAYFGWSVIRLVLSGVILWQDHRRDARRRW